MVSTKGKRWNGKFDTLPTEYLNGVMEKMLDYGDRVQFSLTSGGPQPSYQVLNTVGKVMIFDRNHHILQAQADDFVGANASGVLSLDQVEAMIKGVGPKTGSRSASVRTSRASTGPRTAAAKVDELVAAERYAYFKEHRATLPATIAKHTAEIDGLMKNGMPVADAFAAVASKYP